MSESDARLLGFIIWAGIVAVVLAVIGLIGGVGYLLVRGIMALLA